MLSNIHVRYPPRRVLLLVVIALIAISFSPLGGVSAQGVPSTGFFYILLTPRGVVCLDEGGGSVRIYVDEYPRTAYVPTGNTVSFSYQNNAFETSGSFALGAQGAPGQGVPGLFSAAQESNPGTAPVNLGLTVTLSVGGVVIGSSTVIVTCGAGAATPTFTEFNTYGGGFSGPPLPANRNLVLITGDYGVYDEPNGNPIGRIVRRCQTAFVIETSPDGEWYRIFMMGGWIPAITTRDVAETYGQRGGEPIDPFCVGQ